MGKEFTLKDGELCNEFGPIKIAKIPFLSEGNKKVYCGIPKPYSGGRRTKRRRKKNKRTLKQYFSRLMKNFF